MFVARTRASAFARSLPRRRGRGRRTSSAACAWARRCGHGAGRRGGVCVSQTRGESGARLRGRAACGGGPRSVCVRLSLAFSVRVAPRALASSCLRSVANCRRWQWWCAEVCRKRGRGCVRRAHTSEKRIRASGRGGGGETASVLVPSAPRSRTPTHSHTHTHTLRRWGTPSTAPPLPPSHHGPASLPARPPHRRHRHGGGRAPRRLQGGAG